MSYSQMFSILKEKNKDKIVFVKTGAFYIAIAEDAVFLEKAIGLKCICYKEHICKVGVPINSLNIYLKKIDELKYGYIVYSFNKEKKELKIQVEKIGKKHEEKSQNKNCLLCKGIEKYKTKDEYMEAVFKLYENKK